MLKIKNNVNLKELSKFGFRYSKDYEGYIKNIGEINRNYDSIFIDKKERVIDYNNYYDCFSSKTFQKYQDILYDLIKADLVEKVDD